MTGWATRLSRTVETRDGLRFETLDDARNFALQQANRPEWESLAGKLMSAAEMGSTASIEAATEQLEFALFHVLLKLRR